MSPQRPVHFAFIALAVHCGATVAEHTRDGGFDAPVIHTPPDGHLDAPTADSHTLSIPTAHRPTPVPCSTARPPSMTSDAAAPPDSGIPGQCTADSQCTDGTNGRCTSTGCEAPNMTFACTYDACATDSECSGGAVCQCGGTSDLDSCIATRSGNTCLKSECQVDSDCGVGGYCSPSYGNAPCSYLAGIAGYYCHTASDECTNDSDCNPAHGWQLGFCAWDGTRASWVCAYNPAMYDGGPASCAFGG